MSMSIGCVGCGNMGGAILAGLAASSLDCTLYGHTRTAARMAPLEAAGVTRLDSARELARKARYVVMAVKPYQIEALLAEMAPEFGPDTVVISVAAGISIARLQAAVGLFVQRVTAACLLIALDKYLVRCVEEKHLYFKSRFSEIIKAAVQLIEKLTATDIGNYSHLAHMSVGFYADIRKFRYKLGRDIIYAVVADILKSVHRTRFA